MKIHALLLIAAIVALSACNSEQNEAQAALAKLEKEVETAPTTENSKQLIDEYLKLADQNPEDAEGNSRYLYRAASLYYRQNRFSNASDLLKKAIKDYGESANTSNCMLLLATIYRENTKSPNLAQAIYRTFKERYPNDEQGNDVVSKIKPDAPALEEVIKDLGERMYDDSTFRIDNRLAVDYINTCELYALLSPKAAASPSYLFKAGETSRTIRNFTKALSIYDWIYGSYPTFEKASQALFLKGFTMDNDLGQHDKAKVIYEDFLAKYPNDDFADDTKFLLQNIGKSDDEIIQGFETK